MFNCITPSSDLIGDTNGTSTLYRPFRNPVVLHDQGDKEHFLLNWILIGTLVCCKRCRSLISNWMEQQNHWLPPSKSIIIDKTTAALFPDKNLINKCPQINLLALQLDGNTVHFSSFETPMMCKLHPGIRSKLQFGFKTRGRVCLGHTNPKWKHAWILKYPERKAVHALSRTNSAQCGEQNQQDAAGGGCRDQVQATGQFWTRSKVIQAQRKRAKLVMLWTPTGGVWDGGGVLHTCKASTTPAWQPYTQKSIFLTATTRIYSLGVSGGPR